LISPRISAKGENKSEFSSAQKPYIPIDKILKNLVCPNKNDRRGNLAKFDSFSKFYITNIAGMKPKTAGMNMRRKLPVRSDNNKLYRKLLPEPEFDLPYVNEREKNSFLSTKINLMPRFQYVLEKDSHRDNFTRSELREGMIKHNNIKLPKMEDEVHIDLLSAKNDHKKHQESTCTFKNDESENDSGADTENYQRKTNKSPIKKWLSQNRNFDIKINLIVNGNEKLNKTSTNNK
jgi:hypothetical protein